MAMIRSKAIQYSYCVIKFYFYTAVGASVSMSGAVGLRTDCERLLQLFTETNSVRYEQFSALWRQTNFSLIHYGRKEAREQKEFIEGAFQIVQNFLLPPYSFQVRVGALYLLYGLYYTQLNNPKVKIRMTLKMWCELLVFHQEVTEQQHLDVDFIFRTLRMDKAFLFTATPTQLIFGTKEKLPDDEDRENDQLKEQQSILPQVLGDSLEQLQDIHEKYHNMKCELGGGGRPDPSLGVVKTGIAESIAEKIHKYEEWRKTTKGRMESRERASRIAQIKGKSYGTFAKLPSHIRHMKQDPPTTTSEDDEWLPTTGKKRGKAKKKRQQKTPPRCKSPTQKIREETRRLIASASQPTASSSEEVTAKKKPTPKKGKKKRLPKIKVKVEGGKRSKLQGKKKDGRKRQKTSESLGEGTSSMSDSPKKKSRKSPRKTKKRKT
ncbi:PREDICTED: snRNA-activating protein complex subunit 1-like [Branchiostoma belcheri]|uniref:snRNA-activating protein complex subunit 1-like n=1 Tax=Branchiostoma belcheri TaxID=7741 RepID=A0A6P4ZZJ3_BRABE|nr:PREDICTED: snRNA-activating protein complex subunit 1-like [Branchiostoma belcheri]